MASSLINEARSEWEKIQINVTNEGLGKLNMSFGLRLRIWLVLIGLRPMLGQVHIQDLKYCVLITIYYTYFLSFIYLLGFVSNTPELGKQLFEANNT